MFSVARYNVKRVNQRQQLKALIYSILERLYPFVASSTSASKQTIFRFLLFKHIHA
jgi:hypothetical protein